MVKHQATGYEAEIWRRVAGNDVFVAAGVLAQCKTYVTMLNQKKIDIFDYYIVSGGYYMTWDLNIKEWI